MPVTVRDEALDHFLIRKWRDDGPHQLGDVSGRLCVTAGAIAERNLKRALTTDGVPATQASAYSTIEDIARSICSAHHGRRAAILDAHLKRRVVRSVLEDAETDAPETTFERFVARIDWDDDTYTEFADELDAYFRASNAGALDDNENDQEVLETQAADLEDPFAEWRTSQGLEAFCTVHEKLQDRMTELPGHVYLSRSHLVAAAREYLADEWPATYPSIEWVGIATVNVFDNPTIRFLKALASLEDGPEVEFFFRRGSRESLLKRFRAIGLEVTENRGHPPDSSDAATDSFDIARNDFDRDAPAESVDLIEAPDRRREVERVAERLRNLFADGTSPQDILVVARDAGAYRPLVDDIFTNNEFPFHVETREPMANQPSYRFLKATIDLIAHQEATPDEPVEYTALVDPLRLGFCLSGEPDDPWPVPQAEYLRLEEHLAAEQDANGERTIDGWREFADDRSSSGNEWSLLDAFLEWVMQRADQAMDDGSKLRDIVDQLLKHHLRQTIETSVTSPAGPMVDPGRRDLSAKHSSHYAERIRNQTGRLQAYFDRSTRVFTVDDVEPDWQLAVQALGDVIGEETLGTRSSDASAVRVVDAGNTYFLDAEHVFVLGLSAEKFPQELGDPTFVHEDLREATYRASLGDGEVESPHVFYESRASQYEQELDIFEVAVHASSHSLTLLHDYLDSDSDPNAWSSFVDYLEPDASDNDYVTRIRVDEWLPTERSSDGDRFWPRLAGRDRLRAYTFHAADVEHVAGPPITRSEFQRLALWTDADAFNDAIEPRIARLTTETFSVAIQGGDPGLTSAIDLDSLSGDPIRSHEAGLFAQCELKFYFYQYLHNRTGDEVERDRIPERVDRQPTSRFGRLPGVVREEHLTDRYRDALRDLIMDLAASRQDTLDEFDNPGELVSWWRANAPGDAPANVVQSLIREFRQVAAERDAGIERDWTWHDEQRITVDGRDFDLGPHRVDTVRIAGDTLDEQGLSDPISFQLPVFYVSGRNFAERAPKLCWRSASSHYRPTSCDSTCQQCDRQEHCDIPTKYTSDHRLHGAAVAYENPLGVLFIEPSVSNPRGRQGFLVKRAGTDGVLRTLEPGVTYLRPDLWDQYADRWESDLSRHLGEMAPSSRSEYRVDERFVDEGTDQYGNFDGSGDNGCATCVYQDLCQLPRKVNER